MTNNRAARSGLTARGIRLARRPRVVIASAAVLAAGLGTGLGLGLSAPATPQWCGPLLSELQIRSGSHHTLQGILSTLTRIERQDDAPVGKLMWDFEAQARSPDNYLAVNNVASDLESLNSACGLPAGAAAGEVMAVVQIAMLAGAPYRQLADAILAHPTMAEGLGMLFSSVPRRSLQHVKGETAA